MYLFEEKCAKSLFNMTHQPGGFDADSAFYIVPFALVFGRKLGRYCGDVTKDHSRNAKCRSDSLFACFKASSFLERRPGSPADFWPV